MEVYSSVFVYRDVDVYDEHEAGFLCMILTEVSSYVV